MKYSVEVMRVREQTIQLNGWAVENDPDSVITYRICLLYTSDAADD